MGRQSTPSRVLWLRVPDHPSKTNAGIGDNHDHVNLSNNAITPRP